MSERDLDATTSAAAETARGITEAMRDSVRRATEYVRAPAESLSDGASDLVDDAGAALDTWTSEARAYVRAHPLQTMAMTIAAGYLLGRMLRRG